MARLFKSFRENDTNFGFEVKREELLLQNGFDTGSDCLYRGDDGTPVSVVSRDYKLVPHADANTFVENLLDKNSIAYDIGNLAVAGNGSKFMKEFRFKDMAFVPGEGNGDNTALDGGKKDEYVPSIILLNSYDRSSTLDIIYGGFRFCCKNGLVIGNVANRIKIRHNQIPDFEQIGDQFLDSIEASVEGFKRTYERLNSESANPYLELLLLEAMTKKASQEVVAMANGLITPIFDEDGNIESYVANENMSLYALWNLCTDVASHQISRYNRSLEMQQRIAKVCGV